MPAAIPAAHGWSAGKGRPPECLLAAFAAIGLASAWLAERFVSLAGMVLPVCAVLFLSRVRRDHLGAVMAGSVLAVVAQGVAFGHFTRHYRIGWYEPSYVTVKYRALVKALPALVPENEAVMADPVISTAILAHTRRPIVLQPKGEETEARRRFRDFLLTFFHARRTT